ncbi:uncharacterized protein [Dermacentor albipictus]|uniref:uncharacterized protein isoform X2 n=1 Tax=Dermacentor albipictus TaxID=60249 RepID=UPI0038FC2F07
MLLLRRTHIEGCCGMVENRFTLSTSHRQVAPQLKEATDCFMIRNFKPYRRLLRFFGCFFVQGLTEDAYPRARVTWWTSYTLYSLAWFSSMAYIESEYMAAAVYGIMTGELVQSVAAFLKISVVTNVFINIASMTLGTRRLLEFFRNCARYEKSAKFRSPTARGSRRPRCHIRLIRTVGLTAVVTAYGTILAVYYGPRGTRAHWSAFSKAVGVASLAVSMFYEWIVYLTLSSTCEVLALYARDQRAVFEESRREDATASPGPVAETETTGPRPSPSWTVESVRVNLTRIRELKTSINDIWGVALVFSAVTTLLAKCSALHQLINSGGHGVAGLLMSLQAIHSATRFYELAFISQSLRDEANDVKESAKAATMLEADDSYSKQVLFLQDSIDPDEMCLSGAAFFRLGKPLIISMMGAVITYTVILTQTGQSLTQETNENVTSTAP